MQKQIFYTTNYITRHDLESDIVSRLGTKTDEENPHEIRGTKKQLKKFQLSDTSPIWNVRCVIIGKPLSKTLKEKLKEKGKEWKE